MPIYHHVAHEREAEAVLVAECAASDLVPVGDEQPMAFLLHDHGGEDDGTRAWPIERSGERDGLDPVHPARGIDPVHGGAPDLVVLSDEEGDRHPGDPIAVAIGPSYGDFLTRVDGQHVLGYPIGARPPA